MTQTEIQLKINKLTEEHDKLKEDIKKLLDIIDISENEANQKIDRLGEIETEYVDLIEQFNKLSKVI